MVGNSLWTQMIYYSNELLGFDTVSPTTQTLSQHLMHDVVDCLPSFPSPSSFLQLDSSLTVLLPIRHDSSSWLLTKPLPEKKNTARYLYVCVHLSNL